MKKISDPRHINRIQIIQELFSESFNNRNVSHQKNEIKQIRKYQEKIDKHIEECAPQFPIDKIAKIDVAILRLAVYEMIFNKKEPYKVIIDEAIELGKEFGSETSSSFINGVLGTIYKQLNEKNKNG